MRKLLRRAGTALLFLAIGLCLAPYVVLPFMDRIYYEGPVSDHYDGERFFNPSGDLPRSRPRRAFFTRWLTGSPERAEWPDEVPLPPYRPAAPGASDDMAVTWIGHATVLVQAHGLNILTDPIWSERASPFSFAGPRRVRAPAIPFDRLPPIDIVLVSHNHYDHMDVATLRRLWERDRPLIVTSLGNDTILRGSGVEAKAADWGQTVRVPRRCAGNNMPCDPAGLAVTVERVHHWSSRWGVDRNRALWSGFTVHLPGGNVFFAGDTGFGDGSWVTQAARRGPLRLAILPIGAYEPRDVMRNNHINPDEAVRIFETLRPAAAIGMHWGTFQLTFEGIDDPRRRLAALRQARGIPADRFVAPEAGAAFRVPLPAQAR